MITVRFITPDDMPLLRKWAKRRGCELDSAWLSPHGMLALNNGVPILCAWAATILETSLMEIDHVYASPRVTRKAGLEAWTKIVGSFRHLALCINEQGGNQVVAFKLAANAEMIPYIKLTGGIVGSRPLVNCIYPL